MHGVHGGPLMSLDLSGGIDRAREHVFTECPEQAQTRDAVNVWIEGEQGAFGMRIGVEAEAPHWDAHDIWLDIAFPDGRVISLRERGAVHPAIGPEGRATILGAGPLRFRCVRPFEQWTASFRGPAPELSAAHLIENPSDVPAEAPIREVEFEIEMNMAVPPWMPGTLVADAGAALEGEQGEFMSPRYEQLFRTTGSLRVGDDRYEFTGTGLRIRRQGYRKFEGFWGHCWQSALFPSGRAFGFNLYPPRDDGASNYNEGFLFGADGRRVPARAVADEVPWLSKLTPGGDDVSFTLETADGETVRIEGVSFVNCRSRTHHAVPAEFPIVQQCHARYRWDGEEACGMLERSTFADRVTR